MAAGGYHPAFGNDTQTLTCGLAPAEPVDKEPGGCELLIRADVLPNLSRLAIKLIFPRIAPPASVDVQKLVGQIDEKG